MDGVGGPATCEGSHYQYSPPPLEAGCRRFNRRRLNNIFGVFAMAMASLEIFSPLAVVAEVFVPVKAIPVRAVVARVFLTAFEDEGEGKSKNSTGGRIRCIFGGGGLSSLSGEDGVGDRRF